MVTAMVVLLTVVVAVLGALVVGLLRSHAEILRRLHDLGADVYDDRATHSGPTPVGLTAVSRPSDAPERRRGDHTSDIQGVTPDGRAAAVSLAGDSPSLLAFLSSGCTTCADIWGALDGMRPDELPVASMRIVAVTQDAAQESPAAVARLAPARHTTLMSSAAWRHFDVPGSPYFVLLDTGGRVVGEGASASWSQVVAMLERARVDGVLGLESPRS
jgi:hypothetical protein